MKDTFDMSGVDRTITGSFIRPGDGRESMTIDEIVDLFNKYETEEVHYYVVDDHTISWNEVVAGGGGNRRVSQRAGIWDLR